MKRYQRLGYDSEFQFCRNRITRACVTLLAISVVSIVCSVILLVGKSVLFLPFSLPIFISSYLNSESIYFYWIFCPLTLILSIWGVVNIFMIEKWHLRFYYSFIGFYLIDLLIGVAHMFVFNASAISSVVFHVLVLIPLIEALNYMPLYIKMKTEEAKKEI